MKTRALTRPRQKISRALLVRSPFVERILAGRKTWEIRGSKTNVREKIGLIRSGSGRIVGTCEIIGVIGPLSLAELRRNAHKIGARADEITKRPYATTYAWVIKNAKPLRRPISYRHPSGAIRWVKLGHH